MSIGRVMFFGIFVLWSAQSYANVLVEDAKIKEVGNTAGNSQLFYIIVTGGTGPCAGQQIRFLQSLAGDLDIFARAFSMALTAYTADLKISVYDYHSVVPADCHHAEGIKFVQ